MNKYFKNVILCGDEEFYCLLCTERLKNLALVERHLKWDGHRKKIKQLSYVGKFKKDFIRKIDPRFYCEACNIVLPSLLDIPAHITKESHISNKTTPRVLAPSLVLRVDESSVRIGESLLLNGEWNGIYDDWCIFCDVEVLDEESHLKIEEHVVKLVQSKVKCDDGEFYRKLINETFFCFTCKNRFTKTEFQDHWDSEEHKSAKLNPEKSFFIRPELPNPVLKKFSIEDIDDFEIIESNENKDDDFEIIESDIDRGQLRSQLAKYGRKNFIILKNGIGICYVCDVMVSASKSCFKNHVNGKKHKEMKIIFQTELTQKKHKRLMPLKRWLKSLHFIEDSHFVLNKTICVTVRSFLMIAGDVAGSQSKIKCHLCQVYLQLKDVKRHCSGAEHWGQLIGIQVVRDFEEDFIRFFRLHSYYCSFCDTIITGWNNLKAHIQDTKHQERKEKQNINTTVSINISEYDFDGYNSIVDELSTGIKAI